MKIYTRTGDAGQTGVIGGRVGKDDVRVEAYGTVDELNCFIGAAVCLADGDRMADLRADLEELQQELFDCGSDLALQRKELGSYRVTGEMVERLERWIDRYDAETADIQRFILPGGGRLSAALHVCRAVCRRAERRIVALAREQEINDEVRRYMNRLSDFFFTAARTANFRQGFSDVEYSRGTRVSRDKS